MNNNAPAIISHLFEENGSFPNNGKLPLVIFKQVFSRDAVKAELFENYYKNNAWSAGWRNGLYEFHHYHSTAHEILGVYSGWVQACFGGPGGIILKAEAGDAIIIPAGLTHRNQEQSSEFSVVGGYPIGQDWDMQYGGPEERPQTDFNISKVKLPESDPIFGTSGPLLDFWQ